MEILNGPIKKAVVRSKRKAFMGSRHSYRNYVCLCLIPFLAGCSLPAIKSSLTTGALTSGSVIAASALTSSAIVPAVVGGGTAVIASAFGAGHHDDPEPIAVTAETVVQAAPDNFWTLLGNLISVGGWALLLIVLVPMVFSWLMPGPVQFKGKKK